MGVDWGTSPPGMVGHPPRAWLQRPGLSLLFLTLFVLVGAVLRDINLLVLLGGLLLASLLVNWRLASRSLARLRVRHGLPSRAVASAPFGIRLALSNFHPWLGTWWLSIQERLEAISGPLADGRPQQLTRVVSHLRPGGKLMLHYRCHLRYRGRYRFGPLKLQTRFPFGLVLAERRLEPARELLVHPAPGRLLPAVDELLDELHAGANPRRVMAGGDEGEFYGLRDYRAGDSPRWIHWRTSARRGELAVRQFERRQIKQACLLLDLHLTQAAGEPFCERTEEVIEMAASLLQQLGASGRCLFCVSVVAAQPLTTGRLQARGQILSLLDRLAEVSPVRDADWRQGVLPLFSQLQRNRRLIVLSTRARPVPPPAKPGGPLERAEALLGRIQIQWLNASQGDLQRYFQQVTW
jgi:uncharacterized protein (DUF58 family)